MPPLFRPDDPRARQKMRTRQAVVDAACAMARDGESPTVAAAAARAGVSRATAYRYFPTQASLLLETAVPVEELYAQIDATKHLQPVVRSGEMVRMIAGWVWDSRDTLRDMLRLSLQSGTDETGYQRLVHRTALIDDLLAPLADDVDPAGLKRLAAALSALIGIEPVIVLAEMDHLNRESAIEVLGWAAESLVHTTILCAALTPPGRGETAAEV